jgi:hypothetical protein
MKPFAAKMMHSPGDLKKRNANELCEPRSHSKRNQSPYSASCTFEKLPPVARQVQIPGFSIFFADLKGNQEDHADQWALSYEPLIFFPWLLDFAIIDSVV